MRAVIISAFVGLFGVAAFAAPSPDVESTLLSDPKLAVSLQYTTPETASTCGVSLLVALAIPAEHLAQGAVGNDGTYPIACISE